MSTGPAGHDTALPYRDELVPGKAIDVSRWDWWSHTDAGSVHYYAQGPCPACHAEAQGHFADVSAPIEGQGDWVARRRLPGQVAPHEVEIPLRCLCGTDHDHPGAGGCGRRWSIMVRRAAP